MTLLLTLIIGLVVVGFAARMYMTGRRPAPPGPGNRYYASLQVLSLLMRIFGWIIIAVACVFIFITLQSRPPSPSDNMGATVYGMSILMGFVVSGSIAVTGLILIAIGELIVLAIDVERNTRGTQHYAAQTQQAMSSLLQAVTKPRAQSLPPRQAPTPPPSPVREVT